MWSAFIRVPPRATNAAVGFYNWISYFYDLTFWTKRHLLNTYWPLLSSIEKRYNVAECLIWKSENRTIPVTTSKAPTKKNCHGYGKKRIPKFIQFCEIMNINIFFQQNTPLKPEMYFVCVDILQFLPSRKHIWQLKTLKKTGNKKMKVFVKKKIHSNSKY